MTERPATSFVAFDRHEMIASGDLAEVAARVKAHADAHGRSILVFDAVTSEPLELDLRGSLEEVLARLPVATAADAAAALAAEAAAISAGSQAPLAPRGPGRPKLGVVAREVTLLPRHWDWLASQPGGASVTLRKLVESARREGAASDRTRHARDAAYRFMLSLAGDLPGYEEATRALFAGDRDGFHARVSAWPPDVREHALELASRAFASPEPADEAGA